jgi:FkbM family methyltransferase
MIISNDVEEWRKNTFWKKEPETLAWIRDFDEGAVFYDVGCNIGIYSLYAASLKKVSKVIGFDPSRKNIERMRENVGLNEYENVFAINLPIGNDVCKVDFKEDERSVPGEAGGVLTPNVDGKMWTISIDRLVISVGMPKPNYIKIDVDGGEFRIIEGAAYTLAHDWCKGVLVEADPTCTNINLLNTFMVQHGFTTNNIYNSMEIHSRYRRMRENIIVENIIYTKG